MIRAAALIADAVVLALLLLPLRWIADLVFESILADTVLDPAGVTFDRLHMQLAWVQAALTWGWALLYFTILEWLGGGTLGKRLFRLRVRKGDGRTIGLLRAVWRNLMKPVSAAPCLLGLLIVPFLPRKQALHDLLSGTHVARV